jgi:hypothetical protein
MKISKIKKVKKIFEESLWKDDHDYRDNLYRHLDSNNEEEAMKLLNIMVITPSSEVKKLNVHNVTDSEKKKYFDMAVNAIKKEEDAIRMFYVLFVN